MRGDGSLEKREVKIKAGDFGCPDVEALQKKRQEFQHVMAEAKRVGEPLFRLHQLWTAAAEELLRLNERQPQDHAAKLHILIVYLLNTSKAILPEISQKKPASDKMIKEEAEEERWLSKKWRKPKSV